MAVLAPSLLISGFRLFKIVGRVASFLPPPTPFLSTGGYKNKPFPGGTLRVAFSECESAIHQNSLPVIGADGNGDDKVRPTCALLKISYDGAHFSGWCGSNSGADGETDEADYEKSGTGITPTKKKNDMDPPRSSNRKRNRGIHGLESLSGKPRFVEGVLRFYLAKLYGDIDSKLVVVEGCSRLDKGVHAKSLVALIYCLVEPDQDAGGANIYEKGKSIPGKRLPHPRNSTDVTCFQPLPMTIDKLGYTLNRMLPPDIRIMALAETVPPSTGPLPFHPTSSSLSKTYVYRLSYGPRPDPTPNRRFQWYIGSHDLNVNRMWAAATTVLTGQHNFVAFRGAARGRSDQRKFAQQETLCHVLEIEVNEEEVASLQPLTSSSSLSRPSREWQGSKVVVVSIRADRFLYKMVRFMVGALVAVGKGVLTMEDLEHMLETGVRGDSMFMCAPPEGLVLTNVEYDPPIEWRQAKS